jgi:hypothetical protein
MTEEEYLPVGYYPEDFDLMTTQIAVCSVCDGESFIIIRADGWADEHTKVCVKCNVNWDGKRKEKEIRYAYAWNGQKIHERIMKAKEDGVWPWEGEME